MSRGSSCVCNRLSQPWVACWLFSMDKIFYYSMDITRFQVEVGGSIRPMHLIPFTISCSSSRVSLAEIRISLSQPSVT